MPPPSKECSREKQTVTGILLVRHAAAAHVGHVLAGRSANVHLSDRGIAQAAGLARALQGAPLRAIHSSPLERALETAQPIASALGLEVRTNAAFLEVDYGAWTGRTIASLDGNDDWRWWNEFRSTAVIPGGESMVAVLERALAGIRALATAYPDAWVAVVSHCDVIRPLLAHFLGMSLDHLLRLEVDPASMSAVQLEPWGARVIFMNRGPLPWSGGGVEESAGVEGAAAPHTFDPEREAL